MRAIDLAHNADPTPASRTWTVDTTAPSPTVTAPIGPTEDSEPTLTGTAGTAPGDAGTVTVRVYSGATVIRTLSPVTVSGGVWSVEYPPPPVLALGSYTVEVQQSDSAGNSRTSSRRVLGRHRCGGAYRDGHLASERVKHRGYDALVCGRRGDGARR